MLLLLYGEGEDEEEEGGEIDESDASCVDGEAEREEEGENVSARLTDVAVVGE